jgi:hypothetical protein
VIGMDIIRLKDNLQVHVLASCPAYELKIRMSVPNNMRVQRVCSLSCTSFVPLLRAG